MLPQIPLHTMLPFPTHTLTLSHAFSPPFCDPVSLETPTGEMESASAPEQLPTGHSSESVIGSKSFKGSRKVCGHQMAL